MLEANEQRFDLHVLQGVGLPSRAPPIAPARPHPLQEFDMEFAASEI